MPSQAEILAAIKGAFCRCSIDDIVIFSKSKEEHDEHPRTVFQALDEYGIALAPNKSFLGYPSVKLLGQKVDAFGLATDEEKRAAIAKLIFPISLSLLETYLGMTGYFRQYIPHYPAVADPL